LEGPGDGFITGVAYLNDSDTVPKSFTLLILRPDNKGWKIVCRVDLSDDTPLPKQGSPFSAYLTHCPFMKVMYLLIGRQERVEQSP